MKSILVKKGYDINISGKPARRVVTRKAPEFVALIPEKIPFVKPRLKVKEGQRVHIGSVIFEDKRNPELKFLSPGSGKISEIAFGPRRVVRKIAVQLDQEETHESFEPLTASQLAGMQRDALVAAILRGGLWCLFRQLPFGDIPKPDDRPPSIILNLDSKEPFQPDPAVYLENKIDLLGLGVKILQKLTDTVYVTIHQDNHAIAEQLKDVVTHRMGGPYPVGDPGVLLYNIKKHPEENRAWHIGGQDVLLLAQLIKNGKYPVERMVALGGGMAPEKIHVQTRLGAPLRYIAGEQREEMQACRYIAGGVFRGYTADKDSSLGLYETSLTILPEGDQKELFGFVRPGLNKATHSKTFLSRLKTGPFEVDCGLHGEERACINCGYCDDICAVDILPQFTLKSVLAEEVEESLSHGLLDCVSCGLCTYVCPSKIDICAILKKAKDGYYKEIS